MLTDKELNKIFMWLPYREDWIVDRNRSNDNIILYYGRLIKEFTNNALFETYYSEDGGLGNYLEFICYPATSQKGNAILVCVSLCAPVAAYGEITFHKKTNLFGWGSMFSPDKIAVISDTALKPLETEIKRILSGYKLELLDKELASRLLPREVAENLQNENHNEGNQYLHGIFQKND